MTYFSPFRRWLLITCCHLLAVSLGAFQSAYSADPPDVGLSGTAVALAADSASELEAAFFPPTSVFFV